MSKSGNIRKAIGPIKRRLHDNVKAFRSLATIEIPQDADERGKLLRELELAATKLKTSTQSLKERDQQWIDLMLKIDAASIAGEEDAYEEAASGPGGYIDALEEAKELIDVLLYNVKLIQDFTPKPSAQTNDANIQIQQRSTRLPKLEMPTFEGNPNEWAQFWTVFEANVHHRALTGVEKFSYLKGLVKGAAVQAIDGLPITDEAYAVAIDILKERFHRSPEETICNLYGQLKKLPTSAMEPKTLQRTFDACERILRQLKEAKEDVEGNRSLVLDIWSKYPGEVLTELTHRKAVSIKSTVTEVQQALKEYIAENANLSGMLEDLQCFHRELSKPMNRNQNPRQTYNYTEPTRPTQDTSKWPHSNVTSALTASASMVPNSAYSKPRAPISPCYFCDEQHYNSQCQRYPTAEKRYGRLMEVGRCQKCLNSTHTTTDCRTQPSRIRCFFCRTSGHHPSPLCPTKYQSSSNMKPHQRPAVQLFADARTETTTQPVQQQNTGSHHSEQSTGFAESQSGANTEPKYTPCALSVQEEALLSTAVATIRNPNNGITREVRIILDNGCPRTFILDSVARELRLLSNPAPNLFISSFGCKRSVSYPSCQLQFELCLRHGNNITIDANTVDLIVNRSAQPDSLPEATKNLAESLGDAMADDLTNIGPPEVLIGSDYFWQIIACNHMKTQDGVLLIPSGLGLILGGRFDQEAPKSEYPAMLCLTDRIQFAVPEASLTAIAVAGTKKFQHPDVDEFWNLESIGIDDSPADPDDEVAQKQFDETVTFDGKRYCVSWPWKENKHLLPTNYPLALGRFRSLAKRLASSDRKICDEYDKVIQDQLLRGIIERVPHSEMFTTNNTIHYLPHHPVIRKNHNTTKIRIVYDASSKTRKNHMSLNECLYRGPVILPHLCSVLIRFRLDNFAIIADIEKAFLQLSLHPSERDVTRFLWFKEPTQLEIEGNIDVYRFKRVPFGAVSSPFLLGATIRHHLKEVGTGLAIKICNNIYVDNVIIGASTNQECIDIYRGSKDIFNAAGMNLREWTSNSPHLLEYIPDVDKCQNKHVKVLGILWETESDTLRLQGPWSGVRNCRTKRAVLKSIASIYDPLGLFQPCIVKAKCFLRDIFYSNLNWDDPISDEMTLRWQRIYDEILPVFDIEIPRHIQFPKHSEDITLAVFSDASFDVYAATVYLRTKISDSPESWTSNLVYAKSRLSPKRTSKGISLPRLELLGLLIATRAADFVRSSIGDQSKIRCFVFSDSTCVLHWVKTSKPLRRFVGNRVKNIKKLGNVEYQHVATNENPADLSTRGVAGCELANHSFWWHGPTWLQYGSTYWPTSKTIEPFTDVEFLKEIKPPTSTISLLAPEPRRTAINGPFGIDICTFSNFTKLLRVTGLCFLFIRKMWNGVSVDTKTNHQHLTDTLGNFSTDGFLTSNDLALTKLAWVKSVQTHAFRNVIEAIRANKDHQLTKQLSLQIDGDGLIRCFGRLKNAELPVEALTPVLLPKDSYMTTLIVQEAHRRLFHSGINHTLNELRSNYWIPHGRVVVRRVISKCLICRKIRGPPYALPKMPSWPKERVARSKPFQFSGVDYMGPFNVEMCDGSVQKHWCCLFTCMAIRAVHLETISDCTAQAFIACLSRFIARRGCPEQVLSDNAPQFALAKTTIDRTWRNIAKDNEVRSYIAAKGITWKFITELSPWQGGIYERLIGIVKSALKSVVGRRLLKWEDLVTLVCETEAIVNSRPITYVYGDIESGAALRPMDFLVELPTGTPSIDPLVRPDGGQATKFLLKFWKAKQKRLNYVWSKWYEDYLTSLRERYQHTHKSPRSKVLAVPEVGEVVILKNADTPRGQWRLGRILNHTQSRDGSVRAVELKLPNGFIVRRPVNHLYPLELDQSNGPMNSSEVNEPRTQNDNDSLFNSDERQIDIPVDTVADNEDFHGFDPSEVEEAETGQLAARSIRDGDQSTRQLTTLLLIGRQNIRNCLVDSETKTTYN